MPEPTQTRSGVYCLRLQVSWGDCDPAGFVYFPRFFDKFHLAMERWFGDGLGETYERLIMGRKLGLPSAHTEADFRRPCRFGDWLEIEMRVTKLGRTSIELSYVGRVDGDSEPRLTGKTICVLMDLDPTHEGHERATPWPDDLRARIEAFGVGAAP